jgi:orotidine-5'-phosphate decarboxylase
MNRAALLQSIRDKKSMLCVGLDTDIQKIPSHLLDLEDPVLAFNKAIIDATKDVAVAYKINTAFYEAQGLLGWKRLQQTLSYIPQNIFTIADAKRGDIGNTSNQYAETFFETYPFHSVTVAPYMGSDSVQPFLAHQDKWCIVLGLTSNAGSQDFQHLTLANGQPLYQAVIEKTMTWGTEENLMFVIGATQAKTLAHIRQFCPNHFLLVPGVGAQGGDLDEVCQNGIVKDPALLINASRSVLYASQGTDFIEASYQAAKDLQTAMAKWL